MPPAAISLSIVIPAYNEATRLTTTLERLSEYLRRQNWDWDILVVDDGSMDATADLASRFAVGEPRVSVRREPHRGKGGAVKAGLLAARGRYRFLCDADLSMPPAELEKFLPYMAQGCDIAIGSREGASARRIGEPRYRHWVGRVFNWGVQRLVLPGIEDSQCGFKMFTAEAVAVTFPLVTVDGWAFDVEVLTVAREQGLRVCVVPIEWHYISESRLSLGRDGVAMLREMLAVRARRARGAYKRP